MNLFSRDPADNSVEAFHTVAHTFPTPPPPDLINLSLPSGNRAIYVAAPQAGPFIGPPGLSLTETDRAVSFGRQVAVQLDGVWYDRSKGGWRAVTDQPTLLIIESARKAA